jgi:hypothetical protein
MTATSTAPIWVRLIIRPWNYEWFISSFYRNGGILWHWKLRCRDNLNSIADLAEKGMKNLDDHADHMFRSVPLNPSRNWRDTKLKAGSSRKKDDDRFFLGPIQKSLKKFCLSSIIFWGAHKLAREKVSFSLIREYLRFSQRNHNVWDLAFVVALVFVLFLLLGPLSYNHIMSY